jgi:hypothetical protein
MSSPLTNTAWRKICAAAGRKPEELDAEAKATLAVILDEYPSEPYDHEREEVRRERLTRMVTYLNAFAADYCAEFTPADDALRTTDVKIRIRPDLWCLEGLRRRTGDALLLARARQRNTPCCTFLCANYGSTIFSRARSFLRRVAFAPRWSTSSLRQCVWSCPQANYLNATRRCVMRSSASVPSART